MHAGAALVTADRLALRRGGRSAGQEAPTRGHAAAASIDGASFLIHAAEIAGVAAIEGNGQRELLRAIAGVDDVEVVSGTLDVAQPVGFIPEDRTSEGLVPSFTLAENLLLGTLDGSPWWLDWEAVRTRTSELIAMHDIRAGGPDTRCDTLSGGNQQKLVFAIAMARLPRVIVAEDPTRGLDVQATEAIHQGLRTAARGGAAVIVHSSDVDEVMMLADRLIVVAHGRVQALPDRPARELVGDAMLATDTPQ